MIICEICRKELKNLNSLSKHIKIHNLTNKEYYDKYLKRKNEEVCKECGKIHNKYIGFNEGYRKFCGNPCPTKEYLNNDLKNNILNKYGVENCSNLNFVKEKKKETFLKNFNVDNIFKDKEFIRKNKDDEIRKLKQKRSTKKVFDKKYNGHPMNCENIKNKVRNSNRVNYLDKLNNYLKELNLNLLDNYEPGKDIDLKFECLNCNTIFYSTWWNVYQGCGRCPNCYPKQNGESYLEKEIVDFLKSLNLNIVENSRKIIPPYELDIYIPDEKIAIEFNGLYWHSDKFNNQSYHLLKTNLCNKKEIKLIHIFEDEWIFKQSIVKERLKQILKISNSIKINARDCQIEEIGPKTKNEFLEKFHLQGKDSSVIKLGAFYNNELVSVMTFRHGNISKGSKTYTDIWELSRFCIKYDYRIPGIASKLLSYFKKNFNWKEIFTFADKRWSEGNLYYKLGFEYTYDTKPNYWYIKDYKRIHRFNLRKTENDPKEIPEWVLRESEGYLRIWDCGNMKFNMYNLI